MIVLTTTLQYNKDGTRVGSLDEAPEVSRQAAIRMALYQYGGGELPEPHFFMMLCGRCSSDQVEIFYQINSERAIWVCHKCDNHWVDEIDV